jgi:hypothetical protein
MLFWRVNGQLVEHGDARAVPARLDWRWSLKLNPPLEVTVRPRNNSPTTPPGHRMDSFPSLADSLSFLNAAYLYELVIKQFPASQPPAIEDSHVKVIQAQNLSSYRPQGLH